MKFRQRDKGLRYTALSTLNMFEILHQKKNFKTTTNQNYIKTQPCLSIACYFICVSRESGLQPPWRREFFLASTAVSSSLPFLRRLLAKPSSLPALY